MTDTAPADLTYIAEALQPLAVPISDLTPDPENVNTHDEKNLAAIKASLEKFGQRKPIVVQRTGNVIRAGNGTTEAAKLLGWSHIAAVVFDDDDETAMAYAIADNRTGELASWDDTKLTEALASMPSIDATGFSSEEVEKMVAKAQPAPEPEVTFSEVLLESNNYIVLTFGNDIDWLPAQTHFNLPTVSSKRQNGKPWSKGIGRVVDGAKYLDRLKNKDLPS